METYARIDKYQMARINKQSVMRCIANHGPIHRAAIAQLVGLSLPTVMQITEELISHGMIDAEKKVGKGLGKRPDVLSVSGAHYRLVGVDIGRTTTRIVVVGLDKRPIHTLKFATERVEDESAFVDRLCEGIRRAIARSMIETESVVGVCVAMPRWTPACWRTIPASSS